MSNFGVNSWDKIWISLIEPLLRKSPFFRNFIRYYSYLRRKKSVSKVPNEILRNKEGFGDYDIPVSWFTENKKLGISGIARLKNSADYLEVVIKGFLPFLDEIILVAEKADDGTNEICEKLARQYPDKIVYYFYDHEVYFRAFEGVEMPETNSIHSFAYFTNWAFSKSTYKYVMRLDDDILPIPEVWEKMRSYILDTHPNEYILYYGINILRNGNRIGLMKSLPRCGTWGDNGIYPVNPYTYFTQIPGGTEAFHTPLLYNPFEFAYIHLKNLKQGFGTADYQHSEGGKFYQEFVKNSGFIEIHEGTNYPASKIYETLLNNKII